MKKQSFYSYMLMFGHACADISGGALPAILPFLIAQKGISYTAATGLTFALTSFSSVIQPLFGYLSDKHCRPWLMYLGILMSGCGVALLGFLESYYAMFLAVALTGIGSALFHPDGGKMANFVSGNNKGKGISLFSVGGNLGGALGPMLAVFGISVFRGLQGTAILFLPSFVMSAFMLMQHRKFQSFALQHESNKLSTSENQGKDDWFSFIKLTLVICIRSILNTGINTFLPLFWMQCLFASEASSSMVTSVLAVSGAVATLISGRLSDRFGFSKIIQTGLLLFVPCTLVFCISRSLFLCTLMLVLAPFFLNFAFSPSVALGQKCLPNHIGFASGITLGFSSSMGGISAPLLGLTADHFGLGSVFWVLLIISLVGFFASLSLSKHSYQSI